jgi:hypothetical protein
MGTEGDSELLESSPDDFARQMAEGAGDYEWAPSPEGQGRRGFVDSLDVAFPQWDPDFLARVQDTLALHWQEIADWASIESEVETVEDTTADGVSARSRWERLGGAAVSGSGRLAASSRRRHRRAR